MDANYSIPEGAVHTTQISGRTIFSNADEFQFTAANYMLNREPDYFVYLYNISEMNIGDGVSFKVTRPPLIREMLIKAKPAGNPSVKAALVTRLPQPLLIPTGDVDSNQIDIIPTDTRRFAMDIVNPENLGIDQNAFVDPRQRTSVGNDLGKKGLFWSLNGPGATQEGARTALVINEPGKGRVQVPVFESPTEYEIKQAYDRMEKYYRHILEEADAVEASDPGSLQKFLTPEHHAAADYYGEDRKWHGKKARTDFCPNCGDRIRAGAAFHRNEDGVLCIIRWADAVKAGVKTREQAYEATENEQFAPKQPKPVAPVLPKQDQQ